MNCFTCKNEMVCVDDVNEISVRMDFVKCPKCNSEAEIYYGKNGEYIKEVVWRRD